MKQTAITISMINNINTSNKHDEQRMTSLEIAQLTGKRHSDTMRAIRNMEPAWEKVNGRKFALVDWKQDFDELLIERNRHGRYWVHFAVRPKDNRRKTMFLSV